MSPTGRPKGEYRSTQPEGTPMSRDPAPAIAEDAALASLRTRIDAVDRELLALLNRRAGLAQEVGELKKAAGTPVFRPEREAQVIEGLKAANPGPLPAAAVSAALSGEDLVAALQAAGAPAVLVHDGAGAIYGVLFIADVEQALA